MKKLIVVLLASSMFAGVPAIVLGQAAAPAVSDASSSSVEAGAMVGTQFTWTDLLASVNAQAAGTATTDWTSLVGGITADSNVQIIDVYSLEGSPTPATSDTSLQAALTTSSQAMTGLHTAITGNTALVDKLTAQGYAAADVVAITSNPDGTFLVYVKPAAGAAQ